MALWLMALWLVAPSALARHSGCVVSRTPPSARHHLASAPDVMRPAATRDALRARASLTSSSLMPSDPGLRSRVSRPTKPSAHREPCRCLRRSCIPAARSGF